MGWLQFAAGFFRFLGLVDWAEAIYKSKQDVVRGEEKQELKDLEQTNAEDEKAREIADANAKLSADELAKRLRDS